VPNPCITATLSQALSREEVTRLWETEEGLSEPFPRVEFRVTGQRVQISLVDGETRTRKIQSVVRPFERAIHRKYKEMHLKWE
jgi:hypothetical protein